MGRSGDRMAAPTALIPAKAWTADQVAFQRWLATPPSAREPRSQKALAAQLEVHETTLSDWKREPGWGEAVYAHVAASLEGELVGVLHAQIAQAKQGSLPHAQWLFQLAGLWEPRSTTEVRGAGGGPLRIVIETVDDRGPTGQG